MTDEKKAIRKNLSREAIYEITHCRAVYIMAFIVPLIIMLAIYIMRGIYPFGDSVYLRSDMYHQYAPFFSNLWDKIRNGGSLQYSWDIGMGSNFLALYGYYLSSPINWFIALFPKKNLLEIMDYIIMIKIALSSFTFTYYLCKHRGKISITAAIFGLFYGLSGFTTAYSWNIMWLDSVVLLPLIVLGLERLVKEHKGLLYTITLGLAILSNYYIAIMICLSMVIYFFVLIISENLGNKKNYMKSIFCFIGYSLLAGGVASVLLLPEMAALQYTASSDFSFPKVMTRYFSFFAMFKRHLINVDVHLGLEHHPNIYCGVAAFVLVPLFVMSKKISKKEKITKMIALFIFLTAFNMNIPNFIWHGFHFPNSLPCRQSFIYVFLILEICYEAAVNIRDYSEKQLAGSMWGVLLFLMYIGNSLGDKDIDFRSIYLSGIFIVIYVLFFFFIKKWKQYTSYFLVAIFAVAIVEVTMNTEKTGYGTTVRSAYLKDYDGVNTVINDVEKNDTSFYRIHKYKGYRSKNDATWNNFHSTSTFSSTAYAGLTSFYGSLGLEHSTNAYALNGATPLIYSIFNVKYLLTNEHMPDNDIFTYYSGNDGEFLYKNEYKKHLAATLFADILQKGQVQEQTASEKQGEETEVKQETQVSTDKNEEEHREYHEEENKQASSEEKTDIREEKDATVQRDNNATVEKKEETKGKQKEETKDSPIMKQWKELKAKHPDALLLFRVGDFYEMYEQDAKRGAEVLGITLTKRNTQAGPYMAGFPHHALDTYLPKLIRAGERVAICDQLEAPKQKQEEQNTEEQQRSGGMKR